MSQPTEVRLNKFIAQQLAIGRRQADDLITQQKVLVNGKPATLGARIQPGIDAVVVQGKPLVTAIQTYMYIVLHKPVGYVCSRRQQGSTPTIYKLLPPKYQHLKPVGRLDKDSSGLLLLTNDGDLAHQLTHPKFSKVKKYEVELSSPLQPLHHQLINDHGVQLPDGPSKLQLERLNAANDTRWLITMRQGRNRQIRRTFAALGYEVTALHRIQFGKLHLHELTVGKSQEVAKTDCL